MKNRIGQLRTQRQLSQKQLAEALNVGVTSINNWEVNRRVPPVETLVHIAEFFQVSLDYLLCLGENRLEPQDLRGVISKAKLPAMHGMPVWLEAQRCWALVDGVKELFRFEDGTTLLFQDYDGIIWGLPPATALPLSGDGDPLTLAELTLGRRIWVEPVSAEQVLRDELRGWYVIKDFFAANEFGVRLYLDRYGVSWLAFSGAI